MIKTVFFGTSKFSVYCLDELKKLGVLPILIITTPDMPTGRGLKLTATPVKIWAQENNIECLSPDKLDSTFTEKLKKYSAEIFLVASYGKIIPKIIIDLPKNKTLNIHPSLLPKYRGSSPLQEQILNNESNVGVTIMLIDEKVDHGPIIIQQKIVIEDWPVKFDIFEKTMAGAGAKLFNEVLNPWLENKVTPKEQNHAQATFTKKIEKADGELDIINGDPYKNYLKIQAYSNWPQTYFFIQKGTQRIRVIIKDAKYIGGKLEITKVLPEGKKEMLYQDFMRGFK